MEVHVVVFEIENGIEVKVYDDWPTARVVERHTDGKLFTRNVESFLTQRQKEGMGLAAYSKTIK
jgi:hypothetical protein